MDCEEGNPDWPMGCCFGQGPAELERQNRDAAQLAPPPFSSPSFSVACCGAALSSTPPPQSLIDDGWCARLGLRLERPLALMQLPPCATFPPPLSSSDCTCLLAVGARLHCSLALVQNEPKIWESSKGNNRRLSTVIGTHRIATTLHYIARTELWSPQGS